MSEDHRTTSAAGIEMVRVRQVATGHHISISRALYDADPKPWAELKQDAVDRDGVPLPPKYKTTTDEAAQGDRRRKAGASQGTPAADTPTSAPTGTGNAASTTANTTAADTAGATDTGTATADAGTTTTPGTGATS